MAETFEDIEHRLLRENLRRLAFFVDKFPPKGGTVEYSYAGKYSSKLVGGAELAKHWIMHKLEEED